MAQMKQTKHERDKLEQELVLAKSDINYYQIEIKNFENTVLRLTKELDDQEGKDELIEELQ
jgi:septal ring factor EnvC (AmiA/AmiB activator)